MKTTKLIAALAAAFLVNTAAIAGDIILDKYFYRPIKLDTTKESIKFDGEVFSVVVDKVNVKTVGSPFPVIGFTRKGESLTGMKWTKALEIQKIDTAQGAEPAEFAKRGVERSKQSGLNSSDLWISEDGSKAAFEIEFPNFTNDDYVGSISFAYGKSKTGNVIMASFFSRVPKSQAQDAKFSQARDSWFKQTRSLDMATLDRVFDEAQLDVPDFRNSKNGCVYADTTKTPGYRGKRVLSCPATGNLSAEDATKAEADRVEKQMEGVRRTCLFSMGIGGYPEYAECVAENTKHVIGMPTNPFSKLLQKIGF